jgi:ribosomal protein S27E
VRYRCPGCGNRTRFDVTSTRRTREFWHFTLGGEYSIEEEEVLNEVVESVTCRWCGRSSIEVIEDAEPPRAAPAGDPSQESPMPR